MRSDGMLPQTSLVKYRWRLLCQKPQPIPINSENFTNMLSLHRQSRGSGQTQHATWHWNAIITGMFSGVWDAQAAKTGEGTMAVSSRACHRRRLDWHMLGHITGAGVDGGLPWVSQPFANRNPPKTGSNLAFAFALSPFASVRKWSLRLQGVRTSVEHRYRFPWTYKFRAWSSFSWHANIWASKYMFHLATWHHVFISPCNYCWLNVRCSKKEKGNEKQFMGRWNIRKEGRKSAIDLHLLPWCHNYITKLHVCFSCFDWQKEKKRGEGAARAENLVLCV